MRIGTWNLDGKWDDSDLDVRVAILRGMDCDVLLLTEVSTATAIPGMSLHATQLEMVEGRWWAAIASRLPMTALRDPHGASAMAEIDGAAFCSSVLPWRACEEWWPWTGKDTWSRTIAAVEEIETAQPQVWGGDWNNATEGEDWTGSTTGRAGVAAAADRLNLNVTTARCLSQKPPVLSVDHIGVPRSWRAGPAQRVSGIINRREISDHDAYWVDAFKP